MIPYIANFLLVLSYPKELNKNQSNKKTEKRETLGNFLSKLWKVTRNIKVASIISTAAIHTAYLKSAKDFIQPMMAALAVGLPTFLFIKSEEEKTVLTQ